MGHGQWFGENAGTKRWWPGRQSKLRHGVLNPSACPPAERKELFKKQGAPMHSCKLGTGTLQQGPRVQDQPVTQGDPVTTDDD